MRGIQETDLTDVLVFNREAFEDHRGYYEEVYNKVTYTRNIKQLLGKEIEFLEDDIAVSDKNVLRGIHGDDRTWKLVTCLFGKFYLVVVNCDKSTGHFGKWVSFTLSDRNKKQVLIPPLHGNAYVVLSDVAIFHYKQSCIYQGSMKQFTYRYDDPKFNIWWPVKDPIVSQRDDNVSSD